MASGNSKTRVLILDNSIGFTGAYKAISQVINKLGDKIDIFFIQPSEAKCIEDDLKIKKDIFCRS
ncbi:hypothetical protein [Mangrovivirga cuniculi]|uniref:Uncharacterized protein n=1 Tax=Mangrovivirga cuniculi TaxID=2715131 RepID=A0A4D7KAS1_9BACT|nr:hypothetical protein [Mangrovivirga cuniculi]QCK16488.1 hypothetical protein DCC35_18005 [Mangrovivirga cuniculi]